MLAAVGMWAPVKGGSLPIHLAFGWHPVLMTMAFPCLMVLGRMAYLADDLLGLPRSDKPARRLVHRACMVSAALVMLGGYLCIFIAHWPTRQFLGYDFKQHTWKPISRVLHVYLGYLSIGLVLAQVFMGLRKAEALRLGRRTLTFHGTLGKAIIVLGSAAVLAAVRFWAWSYAVKGLFVLLCLACVFFGAVWSKPAEVQRAAEHVPSEEYELRGDRAAMD